MSIYDIAVKTIKGEPTTLAEYRGKVMLIVNVASKCAFTGQYAALEDLYQRFKDRGLVVLGFPCNQFMHQEPGDEAAIQQFCSLTYNVTFPMFAKVNVNGKDTHPLYQHLKSAKRGWFWTKSIKWNFTKFLVNRDGEVIARYAPATGIKSIEGVLTKLLDESTIE